MNFLTHDNPWFNPGAVWIRADGSDYETIIRRVEKFGDGIYDYNVHHAQWGNDREYCKDIWHFQIRYIPKLSVGT